MKPPAADLRVIARGAREIKGVTRSARGENLAGLKICRRRRVSWPAAHVPRGLFRTFKSTSGRVPGVCRKKSPHGVNAAVESRGCRAEFAKRSSPFKLEDKGQRAEGNRIWLRCSAKCSPRLLETAYASTSSKDLS